MSLTLVSTILTALYSEFMLLSGEEVASPDQEIQVDEESSFGYQPSTPQQPLPPPPVPHSPIHPPTPTPTLLRPPALAPLQLAIDTHHKLIVCEGCGCAVSWDKLISHLRTVHHNFAALPTSVLTVLDAESVPKGRVQRPQDLVSPIQSIPIQKGFMCPVPGCEFLSRSSNPTYLRNHTTTCHPGLDASTVLSPCHLQEIYRHPTVYWPVDHLADTFAGCAPNVREIVEELMVADAVGLDDGRVHAPADIRLVRPFLRTFRWLEWLDNRDPEALEALVWVPTPQKDTEFLWLRAQLQCYMAGALEKLNGFNVVALQIVNTPKGYVT